MNAMNQRHSVGYWHPVRTASLPPPKVVSRQFYLTVFIYPASAAKHNKRM